MEAFAIHLCMLGQVFVCVPGGLNDLELVNIIVVIRIVLWVAFVGGCVCYNLWISKTLEILQHVSTGRFYHE